MPPMDFDIPATKRMDGNAEHNGIRPQFDPKEFTKVTPATAKTGDTASGGGKGKDPAFLEFDNPYQKKQTDHLQGQQGTNHQAEASGGGKNQEMQQSKSEGGGGGNSGHGDNTHKQREGTEQQGTQKDTRKHGTGEQGGSTQHQQGDAGKSTTQGAQKSHEGSTVAAPTEPRNGGDTQQHKATQQIEKSQQEALGSLQPGDARPRPQQGEGSGGTHERSKESHVGTTADGTVHKHQHGKSGGGGS